MMTAFLISCGIIIFYIVFTRLFLGSTSKGRIPCFENPPLAPPPPKYCATNNHDFVPNGYDHFSDYFKCRKCGKEKREDFCCKK